MEPVASECLINVSHLYLKFLRHHFIGIPSQPSFEEDIVVAIFYRWETEVERGEALYLS